MSVWVWCADVAFVKFKRFYAMLKKGWAVKKGLTTQKVKLDVEFSKVVEGLGLMTIGIALLYIIRSEWLSSRFYLLKFCTAQSTLLGCTLCRPIILK